ncbi:MAG TPA: hypothetical protein VGQ53_18190 [Chitinophagaceae bacterium]|jgi:uncharacterized membrane protein|nr:hypothetical protein [Chitinophagaceae bacterium]
MNEENFDPKQSLLLIESMINRAKDKFAEDGSMYLLWGWVVFVCSLTQFVLMHFYKYPYHYVVWFASWIIVIYQLVYIRKRIKRRRVRTYTGYILGYVWLTFVIVIFLLAFLIGRLTEGDYYTHISPILLTIYGIPIFLSGIILRFKPLVVGGIGCWILSIAAMLIDNYDYQFLLIPLAMIIAWIIPGYLLRAKYKLQSQ